MDRDFHGAYRCLCLRGRGTCLASCGPRLRDDPAHTPESCDLRVYFQHGRWFVTWLKLEERETRSERSARVLLFFEKDQEGRLVLTEV